MSLAWSTVAVLVVLLPGFFFFVGLYLPENFTRETAPRSPFGQLAATVFVAFLVHALPFAIATVWMPDSVPRVQLDHLLQLLHVEPLDDRELGLVVVGLKENIWWVVWYVFGTSALGLGAGYEIGCLIVAGPLRRLAEHSWVYDLKVEGGSDRAPGLLLKLGGVAAAVAGWVARHVPAGIKDSWRGWLLRLFGPQLRTMTVAYVLTDVSHDQRYLIYRGFLKAFGISKEGKPLYLVLSNTMRAYMLLEEVAPRTGSEQGWKLIGSAAADIPGLPGPRLSSYLTVSGEHINNMMFDRHVFRQTAAGLKILETEYAKSVRLEGRGDLKARLTKVEGKGTETPPEGTTS